ncbi:MAG: tetratricopeptide repeat protein [Candidatus Hydrogenedentales bacterium]
MRGQLITSVLFLALMAAGAPVLAQDATEPNQQGILAYQEQRWGDAVFAFEEAMRLAPENEVIRRNLANAYLAQANAFASNNDLQRAVDNLHLAINADPANVQPLIQMGAYYLQEGLVQEAIFRLEEAIEVAPGNVDAHFLLGEAYYKDNDATSALDQWEWVHTQDPERKGLSERIEVALRQESVELGYHERQSRNFAVTFEPGTDWQNVRLVMEILESARQRIGRHLDVWPPAPVQVTLYRGTAFSETTQMGEHVGALYDGAKIRVPVTESNGEPVDAGELERRLVHEYVHVVVRHVAKENAPWWFNEGLAETLTRDLTAPEIMYLKEHQSSGALPLLADLRESQLDKLDVESLKLAYRHAHAAVQHLRDQFGIQGIARYLNELAAGVDPEEALRLVFRRNYDTLDRALAHFIQSA